MALVNFLFVDIKFYFIFSGENKNILLQSGKGIPKSLWWKIEATFFISFGGRGCLLVCNIFEGDLGELVFQHNFTSFMKSEN
jgi:hypothetical protein